MSVWPTNISCKAPRNIIISTISSTRKSRRTVWRRRFISINLRFPPDAIKRRLHTVLRDFLVAEIVEIIIFLGALQKMFVGQTDIHRNQAGGELVIDDPVILVRAQPADGQIDQDDIPDPQREIRTLLINVLPLHADAVALSRQIFVGAKLPDDERGIHLPFATFFGDLQSRAAGADLREVNLYVLNHLGSASNRTGSDPLAVEIDEVRIVGHEFPAGSRQIHDCLYYLRGREGI